MSGAWTLAVNLLLMAARTPCFPVELGQVGSGVRSGIEEAPAIPPPPPPPPPPPAPAVVLPLPPFPPLPVPVAMLENARYKIGFGLLGQIGEIRTVIENDHTEGPTRLVKVGGYGEGAIFGFGRMRTQVDSQFDTGELGSRRWSAARWKDDQLVTDIIEQPARGTINIERRRTGRAVERQTAHLPQPTYDPLGFLLRLRIAPPAAGQTQVAHVMEGRALWRATLTTAGIQPLPDGAAGASALRIDGRLDPIFYDGRADDGDRPHRTFTLWLSNDAARVPLRLSVPVGIGDVVVELLDVQRQARP